jgi:RimJ/RimL family protein N-acetyltransferase
MPCGISTVPVTALRSTELAAAKPTPMTEIQLERSLLRPWRDGDVASLVRHANNRKVWRNLRDAFPHPYTDKDAGEWLAKVRDIAPVRFFAIDIGGEAVGSIGVVPGSDVYSRSAEIGYFLGEPYWGRGIMTEAVDACTRYAFDTFDIVRMQAGVFEWNAASMRVLQKCGYVREGVLRKSVWKDGELVDSVLYARLKIG